LYLYVRVHISESSDYTVEGPISPAGNAFETIDGQCHIRGEIEGAALMITDDGHCDKMSGAFRHRSFTRVTGRIPVELPYRKRPHCWSIDSQ
jgi:hypothetical protein